MWLCVTNVTVCSSPLSAFSFTELYSLKADQQTTKLRLGRTVYTRCALRPAPVITMLSKFPASARPTRWRPLWRHGTPEAGFATESWPVNVNTVYRSN
jgi:hypothetical protein